MSPRQQIRVRLAAARQQWEAARQELAAWEMEAAEQPDGTVGLHNARLKLELAGARYRKVLREFSEEVLKS